MNLVCLWERRLHIRESCELMDGIPLNNSSSRDPFFGYRFVMRDGLYAFSSLLSLMLEVIDCSIV
jgi:hypothetical protein